MSIESVADRYDDDVELHEWPTGPDARSYSGRDGVRAAIDSWFEVWEWMRLEIDDLIESGEPAFAAAGLTANHEEEKR